MPQPSYRFPFSTPQGVVVAEVPLKDFKQCPCGHSLFRQAHLVTWVRAAGDLAAEPVKFVAQVYLCEQCGREVGPDDKSIGDP